MAAALSMAEQFARLPERERAKRLDGWTEDDYRDAFYHWRWWARPNQLEPGGSWVLWLILAGRGWGKSRTGAETVRDWVETKRCSRLALVGRTAADVRDVMVEGESGLLAISPPWFRPKWEPSKRRLTWPNGAVATTYTAEEPDALRGPQHDGGWIDEPAAWKYAELTYDNLMMGLRLGKDPRIVGTTTPKPTKHLKALVGDPTTKITKGKTRDNLKNLAPTFLKTVVAKYVGTRLGRQELDAELLDDTPGALWTRARIELLRWTPTKLRPKPPAMRRIVIAIDPSASSGDEADEAGIVCAGLGVDGHAYVLEDLSAVASPDGWARRAVLAFDEWEADRIVAEINNGGEMVELTIRTVASSMKRIVPYRGIHASRGKRTRAEPVAALYEQGRVHHVGAFAELEDELCTHSFADNEKSPNRLDALVWAITELMLAPQAGKGGKTGKRREMAGSTGGF
jgi:phage terminase large subunit-like protein